jgi:hypothetical protein
VLVASHAGDPINHLDVWRGRIVVLRIYRVTLLKIAFRRHSSTRAVVWPIRSHPSYFPGSSDKRQLREAFQYLVYWTETRPGGLGAATTDPRDIPLSLT